MDYFPFFINLRDKSCLVVGGGDTAFRKLKLFAKCTDQITVIAPDFHPQLVKWVMNQACEIKLVRERYSRQHLDSFYAVIAATNELDTNLQIAKDCESRNILVNVVDQPKACRFIVPSIIDRSPVTIALSSGGKAPVLLRHLRTKLEAIIPANFGNLAAFAGRMRHKVSEKIIHIGERRKFWDRQLQGPIAEYVYAGKLQEAEEKLNQALENENSTPGCVYLIGAGPGDPELLTFKALRLMQQADVVLYDRLVSQEILDLVRRDADLVYVGKRAHQHELPQSKINTRLVDLAKSGKIVVRLKGGDPFIFGRGGEEIETLSANDVPFQVVPGITAASGASTYAGIPLTHRDHAQAVSFVTGHSKSDDVELDWHALAKHNQTVVIYMGLCQLPKIIDKLIKHHVKPDMPIAIICHATRQNQKTVTGTLSNIIERIKHNPVESPALVVLGNVVGLRPKLKWFSESQTMVRQ